MKYLFLLFSVFFCSYIFAQNDVLNNQIYANSSGNISVSGNGSFNSSTISNNFAKSFLLNDYISSNQIDKTISYLERSNHFGMDIIGRMDYLSKELKRTDSTTMRWQFTYRSVIHSDFDISKNLFSLIFKGNKQFAGQNIDLGHNSIQNLSYDNVMIQGISKTIFPNSTHTIGIGVGLILGKQINSAYINNASLYTEENGEYLDLSSNYSYYSSSNIPNYYKGYGINANGFYLIESEKNKYFFSFDNAGFINWKSGGAIYRSDTTIRFEGVEVNDIFTNTNTINTDSIFQSITGNEKDSGAFTRPIIPEICFAYERAIDRNLSLQAALNLRVNGNFNPRFSGKIKYNFNSKFFVSLLASYGGYGFYNGNTKGIASIGLETAFNICKTWNIYLQLPYINGMLFPDKLSGAAAFITLSKKL
ncbi:MAG: DUF5723 family protein [Bacteroidota bacterium]